MNKRQLEERVIDLEAELKSANKEFERLDELNYAKVKFELNAWSDAELAIMSANAVAGCLSQNLYHDGNKADSETCHAIILLLEDALRSMESGRVWE